MLAYINISKKKKNTNQLLEKKKTVGIVATVPIE